MNWTLRKKILLGYGTVLLLLVLVFGWAIGNLVRLGQASEAILSENYRSILAAEVMINALERQDSAVLLYLRGFEGEGIRQFQANQATFLQWLGRTRDNVTIAGETEILAAIDSSYAAYLTQFSQLLQAPAPADSVYQEQMLPAFLPVREASAELRDVNQQTMFAASEHAETIARRATWSMGLIGLAALALGLVFSLILSNRLVRPLRDMQAALRRIAEGNYDVAVPARTSDELGRLAVQFNAMAAEIRRFRDLNVEEIVAERRKEEAILQSIDDGLVVVDADFAIQSMNPAAEEAVGADRHAAQGRHFLEVINDEELFAYVKETAESGRPPALDEEESFFSAQRDGRPRHYQYVVTPVYSPSEVMLGVILLLRDVTKLKELDRLKSEFVATASHELKTPLTSIGMSIGLLQERMEGELDAYEAELLDAAREDVERLRMLTSDLLNLSKIEAGKIELSFSATPVPLLVEKAVQSLEAQADEKGIELSCAVPEDLPAVRADANKVTWVLTNLLSNALRYTGPGGHIRLSAEAAGPRVHFSVADDGAGIPPEYQSRIFDKFVQVDSDASAGGSGLGLAICREIVRAHGGTIWVDSAPGRGATFTFSLHVA